MTDSPTGALPHDERPLDPTPRHTADLPATPVRDRRIPATAWVEAPTELLELGADGAVVSFLRRIGPWLLWRAGPARGPSVIWAGHVDDLTRRHTLAIAADGTADGVGPSGTRHARFRTWKEDLRDHP